MSVDMVGFVTDVVVGVAVVGAGSVASCVGCKLFVLLDTIPQPRHPSSICCAAQPGSYF